VTNEREPTSPQRNPIDTTSEPTVFPTERIDIEQDGVRDISAKTVDIRQAGMRDVSGEVVNVRQSGIGRATAQRLEVLQSGVGLVSAEDVTLGPDAAAGFVNGRTIRIDQSRVPIVAARRRIRLDQAAAAFVVAQRVNLRQSAVGFLIAGRVTGRTRPLFDARAALAFGAAFAVVLTVLQLVSRLRAPSLRLPRIPRPQLPKPAETRQPVAVIRRRLHILND
jgi:hypothetical protein